MIILALDSALTSCSTALIKDGEILSELFEDKRRGQAERLVPMCKEACREADVSFDDLDVISVTRGPGAFTGVRIGLATAKGLALALGLPLMTVTTLEVVAQNVAETLELSRENFQGRVAIALDARRSEVYVQLFDILDGIAIAASEPAAVPLADISDRLDEKVVYLAGTGADLVAPYLALGLIQKIALPIVMGQPNAAAAGRITAKRIKAGDLPAEIAPLYLRPPDAVAAKPIIYAFQNQ